MTLPARGGSHHQAARPCGRVGSVAGAKLLRLRDPAVALAVSLARNCCGCATLRSRWQCRWRETAAAARPCGRVGSVAGAKLLRLRDPAVALAVSLARNCCGCAFCASSGGGAVLRRRLLALLLDETHLEHLRPPLPGDIEGVRPRVVGDAVEHLRPEAVGAPQQPRSIDVVGDPAGRGVDADDEVGLPDVGVDRPVDALELVQLVERLPRSRTRCSPTGAKVMGSRNVSRSLPSLMISRSPSWQRPQPSPW